MSPHLFKLNFTQIAVLHQGAGSTIDHFLRLPVEESGRHLLEFDTSQPPDRSMASWLRAMAQVIVVRYLPRPWLEVLWQLRRQGTELIFLMDDDLLSPAAQKDLPTSYRRRLQESITRRRRLVQLLFDALWVTSPVLAERYGYLGARCLPLRPHPKLLQGSTRLQLAYLGTSVHWPEMLFLVPVLQELQQRHGHTHVEVFGDHKVNRLFRGLPRVRIIHPMGWSQYLAETGSQRIDLLLCPLLASPFNAARAPVKFIDAARTGAVGLYSDLPPYQGWIRDGIDGILLRNNTNDWINAIEALILDSALRVRLAKVCRQRALELAGVGGVE
jgi:glycosyltransferase involved in cell wall biosynthesis